MPAPRSRRRRVFPQPVKLFFLQHLCGMTEVVLCLENATVFRHQDALEIGMAHFHSFVGVAKRHDQLIRGGFD